MSSSNSRMPSLTVTSANRPHLVAVSQQELEILAILRRAEATIVVVESDPEYIPVWSISPKPNCHGPFYNASEEASNTLLDVKKLHIPEEHQFWCVEVISRAQKLMARNDNSHNWEHIQRVTCIALRLYEAELGAGRANHLDPTKLFMSMVVHDVGDLKYIDLAKGETPERKTKQLLKASGTPDHLARDIWVIANGVSFTAERRNPDRVRTLIELHPELAIVQDADRLDSLGFVGIARCFAFGGHNEKRKYGTFDKAAQHIIERFMHYLPMMKTEPGKKEARARWPEMELFWKTFRKQTDVSTVLPTPEEDDGNNLIILSEGVTEELQASIDESWGRSRLPRPPPLPPAPHLSPRPSSQLSPVSSMPQLSSRPSPQLSGTGSELKEEDDLRPLATETEELHVTARETEAAGSVQYPVRSAPRRWVLQSE